MKIRRKQREKRTHGPKWALLVVGAALCFVAYWGVQGVLRIMEGWTEDLPPIENIDFTNYSQESVMYAGDESTVLAEFRLEKREPLESADQVSPYVLKGTVDTEDVRFYEHDGVDLLGIARALVNNLTGGDLEGASTITQQLVRNTILTDEATDISFERKIREAELAVDMEKRFSKDEILLMYLNTINYGDGCYGIEAAAQNYFQVSAADLTLAQAATLVGIPQSPTYLNPKEYPDACLKRRNTVLDRMLSAGDITQEEHDAAQVEELNLNPAPATPEDGIYAYPYFTSYVQQLLTSDPAKYGMTESNLFEGGYTIYTSLDPVLQEEAEEACAEQNARMAGMGPDLESALVAMEPETGLVKAMVGGRDYYESQWNIATQGGQPTGSTFKVFTLAAAIEQGIDPDTKIDCTSPMDRPGAEPLENFGGADYGIQTIENATALSSNTGYYRLTEEVTPAAMNEMATRLGVGGEFTPNNTPTAVLGTENCTPLSMANAYATLATGGVKHDPVVITKIVDQDGNVIYERPRAHRRGVRRGDEGAALGVRVEQRHRLRLRPVERPTRRGQDGHRAGVPRPLACRLRAAAELRRMAGQSQLRANRREPDREPAMAGLYVARACGPRDRRVPRHRGARVQERLQRRAGRQIRQRQEERGERPGEGARRDRQNAERRADATGRLQRVPGRRVLRLGSRRNGHWAKDRRRQTRPCRIEGKRPRTDDRTRTRTGAGTRAVGPGTHTRARSNTRPRPSPGFDLTRISLRRRLPPSSPRRKARRKRAFLRVMRTIALSCSALQAGSFW